MSNLYFEDILTINAYNFRVTFNPTSDINIIRWSNTIQFDLVLTDKNVYKYFHRLMKIIEYV